MTETTTGGCFCGRVTVEVDGDPLVQGFCHCDDCRRWSGAPVTAYALWPEARVRVASGEDALAGFSRTGQAVRKHCTACGGAVLTETGGLVDVYPFLLDGFAFTPTAHVHYAERIVDMPDGLPKYRDMPAAGGGSDEMMEE